MKNCSPAALNVGVGKAQRLPTLLVTSLSCPFVDKLPRRKNIKAIQSSVTPSALTHPEWLTGSECHCAYHYSLAKSGRKLCGSATSFFLNISVVGGTISVDWKICFNTTHICNTQQCWQMHWNSLSNPAPILQEAAPAVDYCVQPPAMTVAGDTGSDRNLNCISKLSPNIGA